MPRLELSARMRAAFQRGGSGVAVAAMASASVVVSVLALALRHGIHGLGRALAARNEWLVGIDDATPAQVAWALLGVALCSYHLVRTEPRPPARPPSARNRWVTLSAAALLDSSHAASRCVQEMWATLPSLPSVSWALSILPGGASSERVDDIDTVDRSSSDEEDASAPTEPTSDLILADELSPPELRAQAVAVNSERPISFENDLFKGSLLFLVKDPQIRARPALARLFRGKKRLLWVQVQGQFKRAPPPGSVIYLAWELPVRSVDSYLGFWARRLVQLLVAVARQLVPDAHVSLGERSASDKREHEGIEVPHVAFPLYQKVDELVLSPAAAGDDLPALGQAALGESEAQAKSRAALPVGQEPRELLSPSHVCSFQTYSMFCDLTRWRLANVPGLPDVPLRRICGDCPIRLAAYALAGDARRQEEPRHVDRAKEYLFCFSVRHREAERLVPPRAPRFAPQVAPIAIPTPRSARSTSSSSSASSSGSSDDGSSTASALWSPASSSSSSVSSSNGVLSPAFASRVRSDPQLRRAFLLLNETPLSPTIRQFAVASHALSALQFELSAWLERVDAVAGRRSVAYVFTVDEPSGARRAVIRSASTVKSLLLTLLGRDDGSDRDRDRDEDAAGSVFRGSFRGLVTDSREFQYDRIDAETTRVARVLQELASPPATSPLARDRYSLSVLRATLLQCLTSPGALPPVHSARDIGVQLPATLYAQTECQLGAYRVLTAQCLRQEWVALSPRHVHFFRSFSVRASKCVPLLQVLAVRAVDDVDVLRGVADHSLPSSSSSSSSLSSRPENRWFGIEIHLVLEVVTFIVETSGERAAFIRACTRRLAELESDCKRQAMFVAPALSLDDLSLSVCLNQRTLRRRRRPSNRSKIIGASARAEAATMASGELVEAALKAAMALFEVPDRREWTPEAVLALLDAVERLNSAELTSGSSHSQRLAFALHLYHTLLLHAALVFGGFPRTHQQWRKMRTVPSYLVDDPEASGRHVRFTLQDIERELLRSPMTPTSTVVDGASSLLRLRSAFRLGAGAGTSIGAPQLSSSRVASPTSRQVVTQTQSRIPESLALDRPDVRTCFLLQMNCDPAVTHVIRVYERSDDSNGGAASRRRKEALDEQLNDTCARFLASELRVDVATRVILVPRVCDWYFQALDEQRLGPSTSDLDLAAGTSALCGVRAVSGSRAFFCLQRLKPFMDDALLRNVQHLLMGAGDACTIDFGDFWTHKSAAEMLSDAFTRSPSSGSFLGLDSVDLGEIGGRAEAISLANSSGVMRFLRSIF